jgi:hypothetical protein
VLDVRRGEKELEEDEVVEEEFRPGRTGRTCSMSISRDERASSRLNSVMGFFLSARERLRRRTGEPKARVSRSSDPTASTWRDPDRRNVRGSVSM